MRTLPCFMLENITTEPHAHDISADILRVWLSGYILQHIHIYINTCSTIFWALGVGSVLVILHAALHTTEFHEVDAEEFGGASSNTPQAPAFRV